MNGYNDGMLFFKDSNMLPFSQKNDSNGCHTLNHMIGNSLYGIAIVSKG